MQQIINYFTNMPIRKLITRLLIALVLLCVVVASAYFAWDYFINQKIVTLNPSQGTVMTIGTKQGDEPIIVNQIASTNTKKKIRLHTGTYVIKFSGDKDYQEEASTVRIDKSMVINTPTLKYTDEKLAQLLDVDKALIQEVLQTVLPNARYSVDQEKLFYTGEWYGANLIPNDWYDPNAPADIIPRPTNVDNTLDMLRVIMKKDNGTWKVVAGPSIVFFVDDYPKIPQDIISETNKLGLN